MLGHALDLDAFSMQPSQADEDSISLFSSMLSHNTGFTAGTAAFKGQFSSHAQFRVLERALDDYIIKHTVARGTKTPAGRGRWLFEKDGIVVVASSEQPDLTIVTAWPIKLSFRHVDSMNAASVAYTALLEAIDSAMDEEDRLQALRRACKAADTNDDNDISRIFHGIDLVTRPRNRPLLFHCAAEGYSSCLRALIAAGFLDSTSNIVGSNSCNALHLAAWGGHLECVEMLCAAAPSLAQQANKWQEFPELAAFNRACEFALTPEMEPASFEAAAVQCLRTRTADSALGLEWFQDQALESLSQAFHDAASNVRIAAGTRPVDMVAAMKHLSKHCRMKKLQASFVDLKGQTIAQLLVACSHAQFLQTLHLECCGLQPEDLNALKDFLEHLRSPLERLDITGNPVGDGVVNLFCPALFAVQDLGFNSVCMTEVGLKSLMEAATRAAVNSGLRTSILRLARNDLCETHLGVPTISALAEFLKQPWCTLRQLFLDHTRLKPSQLEVLVAALPECCLSQLSFHGLSIPKEWASCPGGKLYRALRSPHCCLKKLHLDRGAGSEMFDTLWQAIKSRDAGAAPHDSKGKGQGKGKGKRKGKNVHRDQHLPLQEFSESVEVRDLSFDFTEPFIVRLRSLHWDNKRNCWIANFVTEGRGVLNGVVLQDEEMSSKDIGSLFEITLRFERTPEAVDKSRKAKDLVLKGLQPRAGSTSCLESCRLVFLRQATGQLLLLRSRLSPAGQLTMNLIKDVFPDIQGDIPSQMQSQVSKAVSGLSDIELRALIASDAADVFQEPLASNPRRDATAVARHRSLVASPAWKSLVQRSLREEQSRHEQGVTMPHEFFRMLSYRPTCQPKSGASTSNQMAFDEPWSAFLEQLHRTTCRTPVQIKCNGPQGLPPFLDVCDSTGHFVQRLFLCIIPEELVDRDSPSMPLPWLLPTASNAPMWVHISDPQHLANLLNDDAADGFPRLPDAICDLASSVDKDGTMSCFCALGESP